MIASETSMEKVLMNGICDKVFVMGVIEGPNFIYDFINQSAMDGTNMGLEVLGKTIDEVLPNDRGRFIKGYYEKAVTSHKEVVYEDCYKNPFGKRLYSETKLIPLFNENQKCIQIVATVKDITEQKLANLEIKNVVKRLKESKLRYQSLFNHNSDAIFSIDLNGKITKGNAAVKCITGHNAADLVGTCLTEMVIGEDVSKVNDILLQSLDGILDSTQIAIQNKLGERVEILLKVTPLMIDGKVTGIYCILKDTTETVNSTKALRESEERFRIISENTDDLITLLNDQGEIMYASPSYERILGFDHQEFTGKLFLHNIFPDDRNKVNNTVLGSIKSGRSFTVRFQQYNDRNELIWCEAKGMPVFDHHRKFKHMVIITRDMTLQIESEEKLKYAAHHDHLTGLPNRLLFNDSFQIELEEAEEYGDGLAIIMVDIDDFKRFNDELGHDVGDGVIEEFGERVKKVLRDQDMAARLGGDEFVIMLPSIGSSQNAISIAESIKDQVEIPWKINGHPLHVTVSMGIAMATPAITASQLLKNADVALYKSKGSGKNTFILHD